MLVVVGCVVVCRMRKKTTVAPPSQAVQLASRPQVVQAQIVEEGPPMGLPVDDPLCPPSYPQTSYPQVPVEAPTPMGAPADAPPLLTMVEIFRRQLGLDSKLNMQGVVEQACMQLGADATQGSLLEKAQRCWELLGCPRK